MKRKLLLFMITVILTGNTTVFAASYSDIAGNTYEKYILEYADKGLVEGYPDGTFRPNDEISRAEMVALLDKLDLYSLNTMDKEFLDVSTADWYYTYVNNIAKTGIIQGYEDNEFKAQNKLTRYEAISILSNFIRSDNYNSVSLPYSDANTIPLWVNNAVRNLYAAGIIQSYSNNTIDGSINISRGEVVGMLTKIMQKNNWDTSAVSQAALNSATDPLPRATEMPHDLLGYLTIESIGITDFPVKDGADLTTIKTAIGHFAESATWDGNVAFCGHNRDYKYDFRNLKHINVGDIITYKTRFGERNYTVTEKKEIAETDWSYVTERNDTNKLTLITCIEEQPAKRLMVQAVQK